MQCVHTSEANRHAYNLGILQILEAKKQSFINLEAERIISSNNSSEYKFLIEFTLDELNLLPEYDSLVKQIINAKDKQLLVNLKNKLRAVMKQAAVHYVEQKISKEGK